MSLPSFNGFQFNDSNFITERVVFKGFANRAVTRAKINRREGVKLLGTEFGEKEVTIEGVIITDSASSLQSLVDGLKNSIQVEEGTLTIEQGREFTATVQNLAIPDEHYNQSKAPFAITFICTNPYAIGALETAITNVSSGIYTFSGAINISGTFFNRPTITYMPPDGVGQTNINKLVFQHLLSGQSVTVSGFGSGLGLNYGDDVAVDYDGLSALEGTSVVDSGGSFSKWETGINNYLVTFSGASVGGQMSFAYRPRYI